MNSNSANSVTIAAAYLREQGNERHKIWFNLEHLHILYHGRHRVFEMERINQIAFNHRKLMLPLLFGATAACLSLVAIIKLYYNPWLMMFILTAGCLSAYWGYLGKWVLTVEEDKNHTDYFLKSITPNLRAFVDYANTFTGRKEKGILYLPVHKDKWEAIRDGGVFLPDKDTRLYFRHEFSSIPPKNWVLVPISTLQEGVFLSWKKSFDADNSLHPYLQRNSRIPLQGVEPVNRV